MWALKIFAVAAAVFACGLIWTAIKTLLARKTIRNWMGSGVHKELDPASVGLLLGMHPSALVMLALTELETLDRVKVLSQVPLRFEWSGGAPEGRIEIAFHDGIDAEGAMSVEAVRAVLEAIYDRVNEEMVSYSGRETAIFYREGAENMWRQFLDEGEDDARMIPWLLLHRTNDGWDRIGRGEVEKLLKTCMRRMNLAEQHLVPHEAYLEAVKGAKQGYFKHRRDLKVMTRSPLTPLDEGYWITYAPR